MANKFLKPPFPKTCNLMLFTSSLRVGLAVVWAVSLFATLPAAIAAVPQAVNYQAIARKPDESLSLSFLCNHCNL